MPIRARPYETDADLRRMQALWAWLERPATLDHEVHPEQLEHRALKRFARTVGFRRHARVVELRKVRR